MTRVGLVADDKSQPVASTDPITDGNAFTLIRFSEQIISKLTDIR